MMLKWMLPPAVPKVTLATGQEGVCTESQPEALRRSRDTSGHVSFTSSGGAAVNDDRHPVPISKPQSSNSGTWKVEISKRLTTGEKAQVGAGGTNATAESCTAGVLLCRRGRSRHSSAGTAMHCAWCQNPTKSPFHKWMTMTIYSVQSAAKDGGALQQEGAQSTCHHCWNLSCKSKGLPNTTTNTCYINREETSVYFMVLLSSD